MKVPNWQHHSNKEKKRHLKPQALRQARARRRQLIKCLLNPPKRRVSSYNKDIRNEPPMTHYEVKGNLAKLLATENLIVQHKSVDTASFDVDKRILTLPIWKGLTNTIYDLLVGHEVGHALFTPNTDLSQYQVPQGYINVTEDVRIEKLMKRKFPGLRKSFFEGYKQLNDQDFFSVWEKDLEEFTMADRVNLHFKIGNYVDVPFNEEEQEIVDLIAKVETFEDAVEAARVLWNYRKDVEHPAEKNQQPEGNTSGVSDSQQSSDWGEEVEGDGEEQEGEDQIESKTQEGDVGDEGMDQESGGGFDDGSEQDDKPQDLSTLESLESKLRDLTSHNSYEETDVIEVNPEKYEDFVVSNQDFREKCKVHYDSLKEKQDEVTARAIRYSYYDSSLIADEFDPVAIADKEYDKYRREAAREVNYLVKEFECKKSAAAYARASTSKTGILNTAMLHTYKYNEDLFKRVTVVPDGKNHGLIALVDWSGSISDVCFNMVKQLLNIAWFCKKAQIPFNAYIFTTESPSQWRPNRSQPYKYSFGDNFSLVNVISTDATGNEFENQLRYMFRLGAYYSSYGGGEVIQGARCLGYPIGLYLGGTPLSDAIVSLHTVIPYFRKKYKVEKLNVIILSDGESHAGVYTTDKDHYRDEELLTRTVECRAALRNRRTGRVFSTFSHNYMENLGIYIQDLKESFPESNFVSFRLIEGRDVSYWIRNASQLCGWMESGISRDEIKNRFRREKSLIIKKSLGYDELYLMSTKNLGLNTEFEVDDGATKAKIKAAFKKSLGNKSVNKKILTSFVDMVS